MSSASTKHDFGRFVSERRRAAGLTQRELAARLHVTESAVSKWERGLSYPDITVVPVLAHELGTSSDELIGASENLAERHAKRDARVYRRWRAGLLWTTGIGYSLAVLTAFIVNLSVQHTLSWFWIVLSAVALAFSLTTLPALRGPWLTGARRGWIVFGCALLSLCALLVVIALLTGPGPWLPLALASVLLAVVLVGTPFALRSVAVPTGTRRHGTLLSLGIGTLALIAFLFVVLSTIGRPELFVRPTLLLVAIGTTPVWLGALLIRYLPVSDLFRAALVAALAALTAWLASPLVSLALGETPEQRLRHVDLTTWNTVTMSGNIQVVITLGLGLIAVVLAVAGIVSAAARSAGRATPARPDTVDG
ncbi:helix-turn-helix domain-containing protein [Leucobacter sp. M11]|uniref:helix-turn-helix domain-containing protein n=1 Tax=Leucobacter sp. M11 TaxID=2993565 RepID=UPI002D7FC63B|nr:helix-turn-helix domain-containing protein [Leucobacter sp. M11]MEB4614783.1 helix-turn-helix domain-containing protein [Leucobacter sp. M11]